MVEIRVHPGHNLITSPFGEGVPWQAIKNTNELGASEKLWRFDGGWSESNTLEPIRGYYFFNDNGSRDKLLIPYYTNLPLTKSFAGNNVDWELKIKLKTKTSQDNITRIGVAETAKIGYDQFDYHRPRAWGNMASVYLERPGWNEAYPIFGSDVRPEISESETWTMKVFTPDAAKSELYFAGIQDVSPAHDLALIDKKAGRAQDLRKNNVYRFTPVHEITEFEIMVGESELIKNRIAEIVPHSFALEQNYPNPFNPETTIPFALPEASHINVTIYNVLGKMIKIVYNGTTDAGRHYVSWDGRDLSGSRVASGIYFYRLDIEGHKGFTKKMVLMK